MNAPDDLPVKNRSAAAAPRRNTKTKKWDFVVDIGRDPATGRRRQIRKRGYATKKEAEAELTRVRSALQSGTFVAPERVTLKAFLTGEWLPAIRHTIESTTLASYEQNVRLHIVRHLGAVPLQALDPGHLNGLYAQLLENGRTDGAGGLSARTVRYIHTIMHRALRDATRWGKTVRNVADLADPPSTKAARAPEMRIWDPNELRTFLDYVAEEVDDLHAGIYRLAGLAGLRRGEVLGLTWGDVDLDNATVTVQRQLRTLAGKVEHVEITKSSAGRRNINIDPTTVTALRRVRANQAADRLALGTGCPTTDLVFTRRDGRALYPNSIYKAFQRHAKAAALPVMRFHDLRHTHVADLIATDAHIKVISDRVGHSSTSFTMDRYGHLIDGQQAHAAQAVADLVDRSGS